MSELEEMFKQMREDEEKAKDEKSTQDIINALIDERNKEKIRADLLQDTLDKVQNDYFDEVQALHEEIARLKLISKH